MKITLKTKQFIKWLHPLQFVVNENHIVPVYQNVKIDFTKNMITLTGDNLETRVEVTGDVSNVADYTACVNYYMLNNALKSVKDKTIDLSFKNNSMTMTHTKGVFKLPIIPHDEFAKPDLNDLHKKATLHSEDLKTSLKVANRFIYNDDLDPFSNVYLNIDEKIKIYATDRNRMFQERVKGKGDNGGILMSNKCSSTLYNLLDYDDEIDIKFNETKLSFNYDNIKVSAVQQQGNYAAKKFDSILTAIDQADLYTVDVKELVEATKRVSVFMNRSKSDTVKLSIKKNKTILTCNSEEFGNEATETIKTKFKRECVVGFNYKYLIEILSVFDDPELYFHPQNNFLFIKQRRKLGTLAPMSLSH